MEDPHRYVRPALENQWRNVLSIWHNDAAATFGIERLFRLFLAISAYLFPGIYIRHWAGRHGLLSRRLALEVFVTGKMALPLVILWSHVEHSLFSQIAVVYFGVETLLYVLGLLFLSDVYKAPISNKRSYLLLVLNYLEICLDFAVLYRGLGVISNLNSSFDAVYFSFITAFTVGYGDMSPAAFGGKLLVISESLCSLVLITLALAKVVSGFEENHARKGPGNHKDG